MKALLPSLLLAALGLGACLPSGPADREAYWEAYRRWEDRKPDRYAYTVRRSCECLPESMHPVRLTVEDDEVVSALDLTSGEDVSPADPRVLPPEELFALARAEIEGEAHRVVAEFHPDYGIPTSVSVDLVKRMVDDEIGYSVTDFQPLG